MSVPSRIAVPALSMPSVTIGACLVWLFACGGSSASAANATWTNATTGTFNWTGGTNWSGGTAPVTGGTGTIFITNRAASYTVTFDPTSPFTSTGPVNAPALQIGSTTGSGTIDFDIAQGSLAVAASGTANFNDNALRVNAGSRLNLSNSGTLSAGGMIVSSGQFNQSGGIATIGHSTTPAGTIQVRFAGTGTSTVSGGSLTFQNGNVVVGMDANSDDATLLISGGTTTLASSAGLGIANRGTGTLRVTGGRLDVASAIITVGGNTPPNPAGVNVTNALLDIQGGEVTSNGSLNIATNTQSGSATALVTISGGTFAQSGNLTLGSQNSGTIAHSGGRFIYSGTAFQIGGGTNAVASGVGTFAISDSAVFTGTNVAGNARINVSGTANTGLTTGNRMTVSGGDATIQQLFVYRGGGLEVSGGSLAVTSGLQVFNSAAAGEGGLVSGGTLSITNSSSNATLTIQTNGTFRTTGGQTTANRFVGTASGAALLVTGGTMTVTENFNSEQPVTVGGSGPAELGLIGSGTGFNTATNFSFSTASGGLTVADGGIVRGAGRINFNAPTVVESGGQLILGSAGGAGVTGVNQAPLNVNLGGSVTIQSGGTLSSRSGAFNNGGQLAIAGGAATFERAVSADNILELRFTGAGTGFTVTGGTLAMTGSSGRFTLLRLGGAATGATSGSLDGGSITVPAFYLGDRGGTSPGDSQADATFTMTSGTLAITGVGTGAGLVVGADPQTTTTPFSRGFFNQNGGAVVNDAALAIGSNTRGGVTEGTLAITSGTFTQNAVTRVGVSGSGTGVVGTLAVSGGRFTSGTTFHLGPATVSDSVGGSVTVSGAGEFIVQNGGGNATVNVGLSNNLLTGSNNTFAVSGGSVAIDVLNVFQSGSFGMTGGSGTIGSLSATSAGAGFSVGGGTLTVTGGLAATGQVAIGGTLAFNGSAGSLGTLSGAGTIDRTAAGSGVLTLGGADDSTFAGLIANSGGGTLGVTKAGAGRLTLTAAQAFTGPTLVTAGTLALSSAGSLASSATITVGTGATLDVLGITDALLTLPTGRAIGGDGILAGSLFFESGSKFLFNPGQTLTVTGTSVGFESFGIVDLLGLTTATPLGTYTLIDGAATVNPANLANLGSNNPYDLGDGVSAYFEIGSLNVVVVPEPSAWLLAVGAAGLAAAAAVRRRVGRPPTVR